MRTLKVEKLFAYKSGDVEYTTGHTILEFKKV